MDVNRTSFYPLLLDILHDLSTAHFVAFDLELSGVPVKQNRPGRQTGKQSLQERYAETKAAAEKYSILQFGLTCVYEDVETGQYVCRPYNIDLSPLIDDTGLGIERDFSYSSSAVAFLTSVGFDHSAPFYNGVQYLTREEARYARENFNIRQKRDAVADMQIKDTDVEALALMQSVRKSITSWLKKSSAKNNDYLNLGPAGFDTLSNDDRPLPEYNRFQKRLIHQLVRAEFPQLISYSKRGFIQVAYLDKAREARLLAERKAENSTRIAKQKGFQWIIDAILGQDISRFDVNFCAHDPITGEPITIDVSEFQGRFTSAVYRLRGRPRVLVGHNCFLDLVYIYHSFIGLLPDTVEEFVTLLHTSLPLIVDTKYLATHKCGDINPASSLEEIARQLRPKPDDVSMDCVDEQHNKYIEVDHFHEAGFDSLLTAQIAIRLSRRLERDGAYLDDVENEAGGVSIARNTTVVGRSKDVLTTALAALGLNKTKENSTPEQTDFIPAAQHSDWRRTGEPTLKPPSSHGVFAFDPSAKFHMYEPTKEELAGITGGMPRFDSDFWRVYGNTLRIFGTEEGLLSLQ